MPLTLVRSSSNRSLWTACVDRFLDQIGERTGPANYPAHLWLTHRIQRDALYEEAAERGLAGWLAPPVAFLSDLPRLFDVRERPVGSLRRRALIARLSAERASAHDIAGGTDAEHAEIARALDALFGELLPEGVTPAALREATARLGEDELARGRNEWVVDTFEAYLRALAEDGRYDPRGIHAIVAERIEAGDLPTALRGAGHLLIYGLHSRRTRGRLLDALAAQPGVRVQLYVMAEMDANDPEFVGPEEWVDATDVDTPSVQPAPDGRRELEWVAGRVKRLLLEQAVRPRDIAVVARTGREDSRRAYEALRAAGIPATARQRAALAEVPALKAVLQLFRAAAYGWSYRPFRAVLASAYFETGVELRPIDYIAGARRVEGLDAWGRTLVALRAEAAAQEEKAAKDDALAALNRDGVFADRMARVCERFDALSATLAELDGARLLSGWIELTLRLLRGTWAERLRFRDRICDADGLDYEVVRMDQRGVEALLKLLQDWSGLEESEELAPGDWYGRLRRFLESNELALSTPLQTGVRVLEAHEAALFPFEHMFLVHANDGEFPRRWTPGPIFTDDERVELARRGLPVGNRDLHLRRELALWNAVTAVRSVTISYRTADHRGTPLLPSLMVPAHPEAEEIPRVRFVPEHPLNPAQATHAAARALAGGARAAVADPAVLRQAILNAHAERMRRVEPESTAANSWNGLLRDPLVLERIRGRFGPDYRWSASSLERYGSCPFFFLLEKILHIAERDEAEEDTTALVRGGIAHDVLKAFYERVSAELPVELDPTTERIFDETFDAVCRQREREAREMETWLGLDALWRVRREALRADVKDYVRRELQHMHEKGERPVLFEYGFGYEDDDRVTIAWPDVDGVERALRLCGRIDRVDTTDEEDEALHHILDYKIGSTPSPSGYLDGATLQTPLYMKVLYDRERRPVGWGRYRSLKRAKGISNSAIVRFDSELFRSALDHAVSIPERVRAGEFPALLARSKSWAPWDPGLEVRRTDARLEGDRFDADD